MTDIKFTYDGKSYSSISDTIQKAMVDDIKESIIKSLSPFQSEMRKAAGHVVVDIPSNMKNMNIQLKNNAARIDRQNYKNYKVR